MGKLIIVGKKRDMELLILNGAIKQSCDTYFYEIARKLGVDRLNKTSLKFGLGEKVLKDIYIMKKKV